MPSAKQTSHMILRHKAIPLTAVIASSWGFMWTRRGLKFYKAGDYIVKAPTGCVWPVKAATVQQFYDIKHEYDATEITHI